MTLATAHCCQPPWPVVALELMVGRYVMVDVTVDVALTGGLVFSAVEPDYAPTKDGYR